MATLVSRLGDLTGAVRDKINLMVPRLLPSGGSTGQVLSKTSATNYATQWSTPSGVGSSFDVTAAHTFTATQTFSPIADATNGAGYTNAASVNLAPTVLLGTPNEGDVWMGSTSSGSPGLNWCINSTYHTAASITGNSFYGQQFFNGDGSGTTATVTINTNSARAGLNLAVPAGVPTTFYQGDVWIQNIAGGFTGMFYSDGSSALQLVTPSQKNTFTAKQSFSDTTSASSQRKAPINIGTAGQPSVIEAGDIWMDSSGGVGYSWNGNSGYSSLASVSSVPTVASTATIQTGTNNTSYVSASGLIGASASVAATYSSSLTLNFAGGINFHVTLSGATTLNNPTSPKVGQRGRIRILQDATGSRTMSFGTSWKFEGGSKTLTTTANAVDVIEYFVFSSTVIECRLAKAYV